MLFISPIRILWVTLIALSWSSVGVQASETSAPKLVDDLSGECSLPTFEGQLLSVDMTVKAETTDHFGITVTAPDAYFRRPIFLKDPDGSKTSGIGFSYLFPDFSPTPKDYLKNLNDWRQSKEIKVTVISGTLRPIWVLLVGNLAWNDPRYVTLESGVEVREPYDLQLTGERVGEFEKIDFLKGSFKGPWQEEFVRHSAGKIVSYLRCGKVENSPNPSCQLQTKRGHFWISNRFNRSLLPKAHDIESATNKFLDCFIEVSQND